MYISRAGDSKMEIPDIQYGVRELVLTKELPEAPKEDA